MAEEKLTYSVKSVSIGILLSGVLLFTTLGSILIAGPVVLTLFVFHPELASKIGNFIQVCFLQVAVSIFEHFLHARIIITGDELPTHEKTIMMCNHRTRLDWMFLWNVTNRIGDLATYRVVLKNELKFVPGIGWSCALLGYLFVSRNWAVDKEKMARRLRIFREGKYPVQLLIFPEGTDLSDDNVVRSHKYSDSKGLEKYHYLMHPRVRGMIHCIQNLSPNIDSIWDCTIGYPDVIPQDERYLYANQFPKEIHVHIQRFPIDEIPTEEEEQAEWIRERFASKEKMLEKFYQEKKFPTGSREISHTSNPLRIILSWVVCFSCILVAVGALKAFTFVWWIMAILFGGLFFFSIRPGLDTISCMIWERFLKMKNSTHQQ